MRARRARCLDGLGALALVLSLLLALAACRDEGSPTDLFVAAGDELQDAHCACDRDSAGCLTRALATRCEVRVVRKHQGGIASWLECVAKELHRQAECVEESNCSERAVGVCERDPEDACGPLPRPYQEIIQGEIALECVESDRGQPGAVPVPGDDAGTTVAPPSGPRDAGVAGGGGSSAAAGAGASVGAGGASSNPATNMCLEASRGLANVPSACLHCACAVAPSEASSCDVTCWELIGCVGDNCTGFEAGSSEQTSCAIEKCQAFLGGAMTASQLGPFIRESCPTSCMVPRRIP